MKKLLLSVLLAACLGLSACSPAQSTTETPEPTEQDIFYSDLTAIDFLEGYWTDGQSDYLQASRGSSTLIVWSTNLPSVQCDIYVLRQGVLTGGTANSEGAATETPLLRFEKIDDDTISVEDLVDGSTNVFIRDDHIVDENSLDNDYVFWTLDRASSYLSGMWMDNAGDYFILSVDEETGVGLNSNLDFPDCDKIDFVDRVLCAIDYNSDGTKNVTELYSFDIQDKDNLIITNLSLDLSANFERLSDTLDAGLLSTRYIFASPDRAFPFLEGVWDDSDGNYFTVTEKSSGYNWYTNLSLPKHDNYTFALGGLVGVDTDDEGNQEVTMIYEFNIISETEIELTVETTGRVYDLVKHDNDS